MMEDEPGLSARKTLVERLLNRNFKRRQKQLTKLDSLRGGSIRVPDVLAYNPAYGLEDEDPRLGVVGKVAETTSKELSYNYTDFAKDYESFDNDKDVDAEIKRERNDNKEMFRKVLLPGLGKTLKNKASGKLDEKDVEPVEKRRSDSKQELLNNKPNSISLETTSTVSTKFDELCQELEAELEFDSTWSTFSQTPSKTLSKSVTEHKDNLHVAEQSTENEQDNSSLLSKNASNLSDSINLRKLSGNEYLEALLSDDLDNSAFITLKPADNKNLSSPKGQHRRSTQKRSSKTEALEPEYFFGKTYDFANAVRPLDQKFDNHSELQKKIDAEFELESLAELQAQNESAGNISAAVADAADEITIVSGNQKANTQEHLQQPEVNVENAVLLCEEDQKEQNKEEKSTIPENCETDFETKVNDEVFQKSLLNSVSAIELEEDKEKQKVIEDEDEIASLETRLRQLQKLDDNIEETSPVEIEAKSEVLPEKCVEVIKVETNDRKQTKTFDKTVAKNGSQRSKTSKKSTFSRLFGRSRKNKSVPVTVSKAKRNGSNSESNKQLEKKSAGEIFESEVFEKRKDLYDSDAEDKEDEIYETESEYGSVKPWEVKLDELDFYASRNLRENLTKHRKVSKAEAKKEL